MASKKRPTEDDFIAARKKPATKISDTPDLVSKVEKAIAPKKKAAKKPRKIKPFVRMPRAKKLTPGTLPEIQKAITKKLRYHSRKKIGATPATDEILIQPTIMDVAKVVSSISPSILRQQWLDAAEKALRKRFADCGYPVPAEIRISTGFPKGTGGKGSVYLGQCWGIDASKDKHSEIFINPILDDGVRIFDVMAHEFVHAVVGNKAGHKAPFKRCALAVGLAGKMTSTVASPEFAEWAKDQIRLIGPYPGAALNPSARKKQGTRLLKCECGVCGYLARVTKSWIDKSGTPICPKDRKAMSCDDGDDEGDDE